MIREKYPNLDLSDVDLTEMKGYDKPDSTDGSDQQKDPDAKEDAETVADQVGEEENQRE